VGHNNQTLEKLYRLGDYKPDTQPRVIVTHPWRAHSKVAKHVETMRAIVQTRLAERAIECDVWAEAYYDYTLASTVLEFSTFFQGVHTKTLLFEMPANRLETVKFAILPAWLLNLWPVKMRTEPIEISICSHADIPAHVAATLFVEVSRGPTDQ